jgi:hypothetical protein
MRPSELKVHYITAQCWISMGLMNDIEFRHSCGILFKNRVSEKRHK